MGVAQIVRVRADDGTERLPRRWLTGHPRIIHYARGEIDKTSTRGGGTRLSEVRWAS